MLPEAPTPPPPPVPPPAACAHLHAAVELVGRRWNGAILFVLLHARRPLRFTELRAAVPDVSDRMLTRRLTELQAEGLVERGAPAPHPVYAPTPKARELLPILDLLQGWARRNIDPRRPRPRGHPDST